MDELYEFSTANSFGYRMHEDMPLANINFFDTCQECKIESYYFSQYWIESNNIGKLED